MNQSNRKTQFVKKNMTIIANPEFKNIIQIKNCKFLNDFLFNSVRIINYNRYVFFLSYICYVRHEFA